jgi:vitamin K epoxide reductase family protein
VIAPYFRSEELPARRAPLLHSVAARGQATNVNRAPYAMLVLAAIGIFDATYVAASNYTGQPLWCPIIDGCNVVLNSPYSRVFGVPMSYFGFIYYLFMFTLAARLAYDPLSAKLAISRAIVCGGGGRDFDLLHVFAAGRHHRGVRLLRHFSCHDVSHVRRGALAFSSNARTRPGLGPPAVRTQIRSGNSKAPTGAAVVKDSSTGVGVADFRYISKPEV